MILAGFSEEEAKDTKKQSSVRQKLYRMTKKSSKGKEESNLQLEEVGSRIRRHSDSSFLPDLQPTIQQFPAPYPYTGGMFAASPIQPGPLLFPQQLPPPMKKAKYHQHQEYGSPINIEVTTSAHDHSRIDEAAMFMIDNPKLTIENAMKIVGYSESECTDQDLSNQIIKRMTTMKEGKPLTPPRSTRNISEDELRRKLNEISNKVDINTNRIVESLERKIDDFGARIDDKIFNLQRQLNFLHRDVLGQQNVNSHQASTVL